MKREWNTNTKPGAKICCEGFRLTPCIEDEVHRTVASIQRLMRRPPTVWVYLSEPDRGSFKALCRVHVLGKDLVASYACEDLYCSIRRAGDLLERRVIDRYHRRGDLRRHPAPGPYTDLGMTA